MTDHDTTPPSAPPTRPDLEIAPIVAGKAQLTVAGAIVDVLAAVARLEAVAVAVARALDATAPKPPTAP